MMGGGYNSLILPKELRIFNKENGIINIKKFAGLMQLEDKYEYTIVLDAESKFIKKANLYEICKKYFNDKVLYGNKLNSVNQQNTLKDACKTFFDKDERIKLNNYDDYYLWFNQLCIYKNSTLKEFFEITNLRKRIKDLTFYNFDYYIYMYYLILYQNFSVQDLDIITVVLGADTTKFRTKDSIALIEYTYSNYRTVDLEEKIIEQFNNWKNINQERIKITQCKEKNLQLTIGEIEIKELPKKFNIGYSNSYKTKKKTKIAVVDCGYMQGFNVKAEDDLFRFVDKLRILKNDIKKLFKKQALFVKINNEKIKVLGRVRCISYCVRCNR